MEASDKDGDLSQKRGECARKTSFWLSAKAEEKQTRTQRYKTTTKEIEREWQRQSYRSSCGDRSSYEIEVNEQRETNNKY